MREWGGAKTLCNRDGTFAWGDGRQNVREGTFVKGDGGQNVREGTFAKGDGGENVREGTFAKGDGGENVREGTFAKGDRGQNVRERMFAKGDLQGHRTFLNQLHQADSKTFWRVIKSLSKQPSSIPTLRLSSHQ